MQLFDSMSGIFDQYSRIARFKPAAFVVFPLALAAYVWFPDSASIFGALWAISLWGGLSIVLTQIGRDMGKQKEKSLFLMWGGKPTNILLRANSDEFPAASRWRTSLARLLNAAEPGPIAKEGNAAKHDHLYDSWVAWLRERTRDKKLFPLVFAENCNYGFRRNLWGLKSLGITTSIVAFVAILINLVLTWPDIAPPSLAGEAIITAVLLFWIKWVNPDWVKMAAFAYAERLLATVEHLQK